MNRRAWIAFLTGGVMAGVATAAPILKPPGDLTTPQDDQRGLRYLIRQMVSQWQAGRTADECRELIQSAQAAARYRPPEPHVMQEEVNRLRYENTQLKQKVEGMERLILQLRKLRAQGR